MKNDVYCPYCDEGQEINHDDGYGYEEGKKYEQRCGDCDRTFSYTTSISFHYEAEQAPCLNGGEHDYKPVFHVPKHWPDWVECAACGHDKRGEYQPEEKSDD